MTTERIDVLAVMDRKRSPFRDDGMRRVYDGCVAAYRAKGAAYMAEGNSGAVMFRRGFDGSHVGKWDASSRKTFAYAQFRAGQDCAQDEARAAVAELIEIAEVADALIVGIDHGQPNYHHEARLRKLLKSPIVRAALARVGGA